MSKVIGITGGVGAGKSCVVNFLRDAYGADVFAADTVAAELEDLGGAAYKPLIDAFGKEILDAEGNLDREAFSSLIFSDPEALGLVNSIVHPLTIEELKRRIADSKTYLNVIEAAIFPEGLRKLCDEIWYVSADEDIRRERLMSDRGYSGEKCENIMKNQASQEEFLSFCDRIIDNSGSIEDTRDQIISILGTPSGSKGRDAL